MEEQRSKKKKKMQGVAGNPPIKSAQTKHQPITDKRFVHALNDPIFRRVPKSERRVDIDKRFQSMFHDKQFKLKSSVDKRGRPVDFSTDENLRQYYNIVNSDSESEEESIKSESRSSDAEDQDQSIKSEPSSSSASDDEEVEGNISESDIKKPSVGIELSKKLKKKLRDTEFDYARGDGVLIKEESSDSSSTSDDEEEEIDNTHAWGELDHDAERTEEATSRLALCNMDWDRLKAVDLMVLFHSFLPSGGVLKSVKIYVSDYGKQRLADEDVNGPMELREIKEEANSDEEFEPKNEEEEEEGKGFNMEKLRKYQLNRLKYYYAVLSFDSMSTSEKIYTDCDGMEYESSATRVDLRYIPEEMEFDEEPTDSCDSLPSAEKYRPRFFTTTALQQAKVNLTWDETDPLRKELTQKIHNPKEKIDDEDLKAYLATSSESEVDDEKNNEDEEGGGDSVSKYRSLLESIESQEKKKKEKDVEMEITWGVGLKEKTESLVKKKLDEKKAESLTPWEEILEKRKEKRKSKKKDRMKSEEDVDGEMFSDDDVDVDLDDPFFKDEIQSNEIMKQGTTKKPKSTKNQENPTKDADNAELELLLMDENEDNKQHFSLKKILDAENEGKKKKKRKKKDLQKNPPPVDNFQVDVEDSRFSKLFSSHLYNLDPSDPNYKKTKGMEAIISEKQKRRLLKNDEGETFDSLRGSESTTQDFPEDSAKKLKVSSELSILVKSVKRKTESLKTKDSKR